MVLVGCIMMLVCLALSKAGTEELIDLGRGSSVGSSSSILPIIGNVENNTNMNNTNNNSNNISNDNIRFTFNDDIMNFQEIYRKNNKSEPTDTVLSSSLNNDQINNSGNSTTSTLKDVLYGINVDYETLSVYNDEKDKEDKESPVLINYQTSVMGPNLRTPLNQHHLSSRGRFSYTPSQNPNLGFHPSVGRMTKKNNDNHNNPSVNSNNPSVNNNNPSVNNNNPSVNNNNNASPNYNSNSPPPRTQKQKTNTRIDVMNPETNLTPDQIRYKAQLEDYQRQQQDLSTIMPVTSRLAALLRNPII